MDLRHAQRLRVDLQVVLYAIRYIKVSEPATSCIQTKWLTNRMLGLYKVKSVRNWFLSMRTANSSLVLFMSEELNKINKIKKLKPGSTVDITNLMSQGLLHSLSPLFFYRLSYIFPGRSTLYL